MYMHVHVSNLSHASDLSLLLSHFISRVLMNLFVGCQLCMGHAVDKELLSLVQKEVKGIIADLAGHNARLNAVETKLEKDEEARREETDKILERLVSMEKLLSKELLRRVEEVELGLAETNIKVEVQGKRVEEGMAQLQDSITKTVEQLVHEFKSQGMENVKPG